ncbi:E3 ubiquitin ligase BIG BROTHER-related [Apostasia shenzhenica]|uniref:E3 ubiquitin ligase BIG BROTHER-related n=1 Tax=Apostasia shenzhenica TaxID=1088818 RepID=A0A2I0AL29_9ASPA|nr:E3 ubiquitin ligase BIG BROTHER-related [Apostasia shenzhenica]
MENARESSSAGDVAPNENPNPNSSPDADALEDDGSANEMSARQRRRTPFTSLSQVDADLALARALQEQERAYMMLRMNGGDDSDYVSSDAGSYEYEEELDEDPNHPADDDRGSGEGSDYGEDAFDANNDVINPADFDSDEAYARALQDAEERDVAVRLMALSGLNDQDAWQEVDPDELSYEELVALGEVVGTESRGLSADIIDSLPSVSYKAQSVDGSYSDQCVICRLDYEDGDTLVVLPCKHNYHTECINKWLQLNKVLSWYRYNYLFCS